MSTRPLDILYVMDPMEAIGIAGDTTFAFQEEAQARGHRNYHCEPRHLFAEGGDGWAICRPVEVGGPQGAHFRFGPPQTRPLSAFGAVLMRKDPPFDMAYVFATYLLERTDTFVMNRPGALRDANEKLWALRFPDLMPETLVTADAAAVRRFVERQGGRAVIKPLDGAGGEGVFLLAEGDQNTNAIIEASTHHGRRYAMVQRYIPEIRTTGDRRVLLLDGELLGALARIPPEGELRGNLHVGGASAEAHLGAREHHIIATIGPALRAAGLWFVGLDLIGDYLTEVNVTSPTGIQELGRLNGFDPSDQTIAWIERHHPEYLHVH